MLSTQTDKLGQVATHLVQSLYNLSNMATMMELIDSHAFSECYGVDPGNDISDRDNIWLPLNRWAFSGRWKNS